MDLTGIGEDGLDVLAAIVRGPDATVSHPGPCWTRRAVLEERWPAELLDDLVVNGWLETWEGIVGGDALTLTPLAAGRLRVELDEFDVDETPSWVAAGQSDHPIRIPRHLRCGLPLPYPERVVDPRSVREQGVLTFDDRDASDYATDHQAGDPVRLWGMSIVIDNRIKPAKAS
jgi:hypothetical protein